MRCDEVLRLLTQGVQSLLSEESFQQFLAFRAKFHNYSWHNCLLILVQRPDATRVAGYRKWLELHRYVRHGEKGIAILAPLIKKVAAESDHEDAERSSDQPTVKTLVGFRVVHVFDVSQTEGEPLPEGPQPKLLIGNDGGLLIALRDFAGHTGWQIKEELSSFCESANGECSPQERIIRIKPDMDDLQKAKTLAHELAHSLLHIEDHRTPRPVKEVEAESVAFVVLASSGFADQVGEYSFPYLAHWLSHQESADVNVITERFEIILNTADDILAGIAV